MPTQTLLIALDGVDFNSCRLAQAAGAAPYLEELSERLLTRPIPFEPTSSDDAMWATFQYGAGLGEHGRYFWKRDDLSRKDAFRYCDSGEEHLTPFWLEEVFAQKNIAIFDLPKMRLAKPQRGFHLANWLVHGRYGTEGATSSPPEIAVHVRNRFGEPPPSPCGTSKKSFSEAEIETFVGHLLQSIDMKLSAATHYLFQDSWDIFMTSFKELHCASHALWEHLPNEPEAFVSSPFHRLFQATDKAVEKLIKIAGPNCKVCLFSPSGMSANSSVTHLAEGILLEAGKQTTPGLQRLIKGEPYHIVPYNENSLAVRIRWRSRKDALCSALVKFMSQLTLEGSKPVFERPLVSQKVWAGPAAKQLPDLVFPLRAGLGRPETLYTAAGETITGEATALRAGNHFGDGFCYLSPAFHEVLPGPEIRLEDLGRAVLSV